MAFELVEDSHVVVPEHADIRDAVREHADALDAHSDLEAATEDLPGEVLETALEVGHRDALVDRETLDLHEAAEVRRVLRVAPVDAPGTDDVDGWLLALHGPDLYR